METTRIYLATKKEIRHYQRWKTDFVSDFRIYLRRKYFVAKVRSKITFSYEIFFSFLISLLILRIPVVTFAMSGLFIFQQLWNIKMSFITDFMKSIHMSEQYHYK